MRQLAGLTENWDGRRCSILAIGGHKASPFVPQARVRLDLLKDHSAHLTCAHDEHPITPPPLPAQPGTDLSMHHPSGRDEQDGQSPTIKDHPPRIIQFQRAVLEKQRDERHPHQRAHGGEGNDRVELVDSRGAPGQAVQPRQDEHTQDRHSLRQDDASIIGEPPHSLRLIRPGDQPAHPIGQEEGQLHHRRIHEGQREHEENLGLCLRLHDLTSAPRSIRARACRSCSSPCRNEMALTIGTCSHQGVCAA